MKIKVTEDMRHVITLADVDSVKAVQETFAEQKNFKWEAEQMLTLAAEENALEILKTEAHIAKNGRIWDYYGNGSGRFDVYISVTGYSFLKGFFIVSGYVSDIWSLSSDNREEIRHYLYIQRFRPDKVRISI